VKKVSSQNICEQPTN